MGTEAQIDGGGIEGVDGLGKLYCELFVEVELPCGSD
jgi:hypothetical protein